MRAYPSSTLTRRWEIRAEIIVRILKALPHRAGGIELQSIEHWVGGRATPGTSGRSAPVFDPALGVQTKTVSLASAAEIDDAVRCAVEAAAHWRESPLGQRTDKMFRLRELIVTTARIWRCSSARSTARS